MTVFLNGSNCTAKFQFIEYGTFPESFDASSAKAAMPRLFRKTNPFGSVPRIESRVPVVPCNGGLPDKRMGTVAFAVPDELVASVLAVTKPPKSGFGERLLPVSGACEMP